MNFIGSKLGGRMTAAWSLEGSGRNWGGIRIWDRSDFVDTSEGLYCLNRPNLAVRYVKTLVLLNVDRGI